MTKDEYKIIAEIAKRGLKLFDEIAPNINVNYTDLFMDIEYTHQINPLRLQELLVTDDGNFGHDVVGIYQNFNRITKELDNCFSPRYSVN